MGDGEMCSFFEGAQEMEQSPRESEMRAAKVLRRLSPAIFLARSLPSEEAPDRSTCRCAGEVRDGTEREHRHRKCERESRRWRRDWGWDGLGMGMGGG